MEEKRRDAGTPPPATDVPAAEATSSRRRGGGQKRKASALGSGSTSTPPTTSSKRQAREKPPPVPFTPIHNGPLTRARQQPNNSATAAVSVSSSVLKIDGELRGGDAVVSQEELNDSAREDWEALEAKIEAEYEAIRSRDANVHVVPNHAGDSQNPNFSCIVDFAAFMFEYLRNLAFLRITFDFFGTLFDC